MGKLHRYLGEQDNIKTLEDYDIEYQEELFTKLGVYDPDVLLVSDKLSGPFSKYELAEELTKLNKKMKIIFILRDPEDQTYIKFLKEKGIRNYFDISTTDVNNELIPAILFEDVYKEELKKIVTEEVASAAEETKTEKIYLKKEIIAVASPGGGGVGKTTVATNLAILAAEKYPGINVALLDLSDEKADIAKVLNIPSELGLEKLKKHIKEDEFNAINILKNIEVYDVSTPNLYVMTGIKRLIDSDVYSLGHYNYIIDVLNREFDLLIIDTGFFRSTATYSAIDKATKVLFLVRDTETTVKSLDEKLKFYKNDLGLDIETKSEILMNMTVGHEDLDKRSVANIFDKEPLGEIEFNSEIVFATEKYILFASKSHRKKFKKESKTLDNVLDNMFKVHYEEQKNLLLSLKERLIR